MKSKDIVKLREKKSPRTGVSSLYLELYRDGKRTFEFLHMYLNPGKDPTTKAVNKATLEAAKTIQAQRIVEVQQGEAKILAPKKQSALFRDQFLLYLEKRPQCSISHRRNLEITLRRWTDYAGENIRLKDITPSTLLGFVEYLRGDLQRNFTDKDGNPSSTPVKMKESSIRRHYDRVVWVLNSAHKDGLIPSNPADHIDKASKPKVDGAERAYLTGEDLSSLIKARCPDPELKRAFLFACYTGLRKSDVYAMKWENVQGRCVSIRVKKTHDPITIPLSDNAMKYLGPRKADEELIFKAKSDRQASDDLLTWARNAGVRKHVTFHVSRHTFSTLALTYGADIYTVSKLLGHANLRTTQIYAQIVDKKKEEAVNLIPDFG